MEEALVRPPPSVAAARRRSHLDSASYRTLASLFSHCFTLPSPPEIPSACEGATSRPEEREEVGTAVGNPSGNGDEAAGGPLQAPQCSPASEAAASGRRRSEEEAVVVDSGAGYSAPACKGSGFDQKEGAEEEAVLANPSSEEFCPKDNALCEELASGAELEEEDEILKSLRGCFDAEGEKSAGDGLVNEDDQLLLNDMISDLSGLLDGVHGGAMAGESCKFAGVELQNEEQMPSAAEQRKELGGAIEEDTIRNSDHDQLHGDKVEEGEIEGDVQDLDEEDLGSDSEDEVVDDEKSEDFVREDSAGKEAHDDERRSGNSLADGHLKPQNKGIGAPVPNVDGSIKNVPLDIPRLPAVSYEEILDWNETPLPADEDPKADTKRKRVLTEERKAKKKKAKRIKRAQQERAQGVKRLRLKPVVKPKVVRYCHFYLQGKCQQGDLCKYSHDTTPLTKSKACVHFARGSCLKGDDCPYDHELSKYPCHNFMEKGMCGRGDKCKFSHVMPAVEGPSSTLDAKKSESRLPSEKPDYRKQTNGQETSKAPNGESRTSRRPYSILKNLGDISVNTPKAPSLIPKGVRFLSIGKEKSESNNPHQDDLPTEKQSEDNHQQSLGGRGAEGHTIAEHTWQKSLSRPDDNNISRKATLNPSLAPKKTSLDSNPSSEASRILQEFLFGAGS